eukprot:679727-Prymnesium_polylepis.1
MEEWVAVSSLPKGWRALAHRMMREAGLAIGRGVAARSESARRAVEARRAVAVEAGAAKQVTERDARAKDRAEAAATRGAGAQGGEASWGTTDATDESRCEDANGLGEAGRKRSGCAAAMGAPRRAGGRVAADTLGEGRKRDAQAAN